MTYTMPTDICNNHQHQQQRNDNVHRQRQQRLMYYACGTILTRLNAKHSRTIVLTAFERQGVPEHKLSPLWMTMHFKTEVLTAFEWQCILGPRSSPLLNDEHSRTEVLTAFRLCNGVQLCLSTYNPSTPTTTTNTDYAYDYVWLHHDNSIIP